MTSKQTVQAMYDRFAGGDVAGVLALLDPQVVWRTPARLPWSRGEYHGREGVAEYFGHFAGALEDAAVRPAEVLGAGDRVVVLGEERGRCRATGRVFRTPFAHVLEVRDEQVTRFEGHVDTALVAEAFSPAGVAA